MNYAKIRNYDIANGEGVRTSLFVSGCTNHCPGCFNPEEQDFNCGRPFTKETIAEIHKMLANPVISGLSLLGGDPLCQDYGGIHNLIDLCFYTHSIGKTVWLWTGFIWEDCYNPLFPDKDEDDHQLLMEEYLPIKNFELLYGWWKQHYKATLKDCDNPQAIILHLASTD